MMDECHIFVPIRTSSELRWIYLWPKWLSIGNLSVRTDSFKHSFQDIITITRCVTPTRTSSFHDNANGRLAIRKNFTFWLEMSCLKCWTEHDQSNQTTCICQNQTQNDARYVDAWDCHAALEYENVFKAESRSCSDDIPSIFESGASEMMSDMSCQETLSLQQ